MPLPDDPITVAFPAPPPPWPPVLLFVLLLAVVVVVVVVLLLLVVVVLLVVLVVVVLLDEVILLVLAGLLQLPVPPVLFWKVKSIYHHPYDHYPSHSITFHSNQRPIPTWGSVLYQSVMLFRVSILNTLNWNMMKHITKSLTCEGLCLNWQIQGIKNCLSL